MPREIHLPSEIEDFKRIQTLIKGKVLLRLERPWKIDKCVDWQINLITSNNPFYNKILRKFYENKCGIFTFKVNKKLKYSKERRHRRLLNYSLWVNVKHKDTFISNPSDSTILRICCRVYNVNEFNNLKRCLLN